jgi:hypothetical protein
MATIGVYLKKEPFRKSSQYRRPKIAAQFFKQPVFMDGMIVEF